MEQQILLIEDDSALGRGVAVALTEPGRIVALARDLQQARQRWEQLSFELVVLDLNLPDGNGLLRLLTENRGHTLTREQLLEKVWDGGEFVDENALSVAVKRLRDKLTDAPIKTVYGLGYTWEVR